MIALSRPLACALRAVGRKSIPAGSPRGVRPPVILDAGRHGLRVRIPLPDVALEYRQAGSLNADSITLPGEALDDFAGRTGVVELENVNPGTVRARWDDGGVPQVRQYPVPAAEQQPPFPEAPARLVPSERHLPRALDDGARCTAKDGVRFALQRLQLRGDSGDVIASDGRQLLIQRGFRFPWKGDVLVPAVAAFGCRELADGPVGVGRTDTHVVLRVGPWTLHLAIDKNGRYPKAETVIPSSVRGATTCRLAPEDAAFLARGLPRLPDGDDEDAPVTVDLNGHLAVRARGEGPAPPAELVLARSPVEGPPLRFVTNRKYLSRMVQLGFAELKVVKAEAPVVCRDGGRTFVWMPLGKEGALPPGDNYLRIASTTAAPGLSPSPATEERRIIAMPTPPAGGKPNGPASPPPVNDGARKPAPGIDALLEEAAELRALLRDAYARAGQLVEGLKAHRQRSRLLRGALSSLKQLQQIDG